MARIPALTNSPSSIAKNNLTAKAGYEFEASEDIVVHTVGRPVGPGMTQDHLIQIWAVSNQTLVASATVTSSSTVENGYAIVDLATPVTLTNGSKYRIVSDEVSGGDSWADQTGQAESPASSLVTVIVAVFKTAAGGQPNDPNDYPTSVSGRDMAFVWPNLYKFVVVPNVDPFANANFSGVASVTQSSGDALVRFNTSGTPSVDFLASEFSIYKDDSVVAETGVTITPITNHAGDSGTHQLKISLATLSVGSTYGIKVNSAALIEGNALTGWLPGGSFSLVANAAIPTADDVATAVADPDSLLSTVKTELDKVIKSGETFTAESSDSTASSTGSFTRGTSS